MDTLKRQEMEAEALFDFVAIGPAVGGLILLATTKYLSGYWTETNLAEVGKFLA